MKRGANTSVPLLVLAALVLPLYGADAERIEDAAKKALLGLAKLRAGALAQRPAVGRNWEEKEEEILKLEDLVEEALRRNPDIRAAQRRWEAASKRPSQLSALPDPVVGLMYWNAGSPIPGSAVGENMTSFVEPNFTQEIPFPAKLRLRGEIAGKEAARAAEELRAIELRVVSELKEAYFDLFFTTKALEIIEKNRGLLEQLSKIAEARYAVGKGTQADVLRSQVELSLLVDRLTTLEQRRGSLEARINSLLDRSPNARLGRPAQLERSPFDYTLERLLALVEEANPALKSRELAIDSSALALRLAKKEYLPDFSFSIGYMYMGRFEDMYDVRIGVKIPLYFWRKQRLGVEEAAASLAGAKQEYRATAQELFFRIKDLYLMVKTAERLMELYQKGIIPQASASVESALSGYEVGSVDFPALVDSFVFMLNYELEFYRQLVEREKALAKLEELTATRLIK